MQVIAPDKAEHDAPLRLRLTNPAARSFKQYKNHHSRKTIIDYLEDCAPLIEQYRAQGWTARQIAESLGVKQETYYDITSRW